MSSGRGGRIVDAGRGEKECKDEVARRLGYKGEWGAVVVTGVKNVTCHYSPRRDTPRGLLHEHEYV